MEHPWNGEAPPGFVVSTDFLARPALTVARELLGCVIVSTLDDSRVSGVIVETEAYEGPGDPASHAATVAGRTERNRAMFGPPGRAYVYRSYGVHWCLNVVTGQEGVPEAVLLRGIAPLAGLDVMARRRSGRSPLTAGPGRLCQALGVTDASYGHDLTNAPLRVEHGWTIADDRVGVSGRVGVGAAAQWPYRFYVRGAPGVSRPDGWSGERR